MSKIILSSREEIAKIDKSNVLGSVEALADQVADAWRATQKIKVDFKEEIHNVVIAGMGGSGLGADVIKSLFKAELKVPLDFVHSYTLPGYVNKNSLVVLASYSGNTEEVLSAMEDAQDRKAQIVTICAGGELAKTADAFSYPTYLIEPKFNPSNQPRMAIGYAVFGTLALLSKVGIISLTKTQVEEAVAAINQVKETCTVEVADDKNLAKQLTYHIHQLRAVLVGAEFLEGAVHTSTNQFNENAKAYADYKVIPEINHHLMEGLKFPDSNQHSHTFIFINSDLYLERNKKRMELTKKIVEKNGISTFTVKLKSKTKIAQVFESIAIFAYVNLYLSMIEGIDPAPIPFVDWFKEQLAK